MRLKVSSAKRRPFCLGLNVLMICRHSGVNKRGHKGRKEMIGLLDSFSSKLIMVY